MNSTIKKVLINNDSRYLKGVIFLREVKTHEEATNYRFLFGVRLIVKHIADLKFRTSFRFKNILNLSAKIGSFM